MGQQLDSAACTAPPGGDPARWRASPWRRTRTRGRAVAVQYVEPILKANSETHVITFKVQGLGHQTRRFQAMGKLDSTAVHPPTVRLAQRVRHLRRIQAGGGERLPRCSGAGSI
jgi:hypothetical protein